MMNKDMPLYHVSDAVFTKEDLIGATFVETYANREDTSMVITEENVLEVNGAVLYWTCNIVSIPNDNFVYEDTLFDMPLLCEFEKAGTYFIKGNDSRYGEFYPISLTFANGDSNSSTP